MGYRYRAMRCLSQRAKQASKRTLFRAQKPSISKNTVANNGITRPFPTRPCMTRPNMPGRRQPTGNPPSPTEEGPSVPGSQRVQPRFNRGSVGRGGSSHEHMVRVARRFCWRIFLKRSRNLSGLPPWQPIRPPPLPPTETLGRAAGGGRLMLLFSAVGGHQ